MKPKRSILILGMLLFGVELALAFPAWMGVYGEFSRHDSGNPGTFTILMNEDYWGLKAEVGFRVNGDEWTALRMDYSHSTKGNSVWTIEPDTPFSIGDQVEFYFHGFDKENNDIWDTNGGQNYSFTAGHPQLTRGPYLQRLSPGGVIVRWRTQDPVSSYVWVGSTPSTLQLHTSLDSLTTEHRVEVSGLAEKTSYYYAIGTAEGPFTEDDYSLRFTTAPAPGSSEYTRVWVIGDAGTADQNQADVRDGFKNWLGSNKSLDHILLLGDNAYFDGTDGEYQNAFFNMYPELLRRTCVWSAYGNHDSHSADADSLTGVYFDTFSFPRNGQNGGVASESEAYYSFDLANIHFVSLDTSESDRAPDSAMLTWLTDDLNTNTQTWTVVFTHHPPYTKGSHDSDVEFPHAEIRTNILPIVENAGVDLFLSGHSHNYERSTLIKGHYGKSWTFNDSMIVDSGSGRADEGGAYIKTGKDGTVYVVNGNGGKMSSGPLNHPAMFYSENALGSGVIEVNGDRLDYIALDKNGDTMDHFTISKGGIPLEWAGNHTRWPQTESIATGEDLWVNVESWPRGAGVSASLIYTLDGNTWSSLGMSETDPVGNNDAWHVNTGTFPSGTMITYAVRVKDASGNSKWVNNSGQDYSVLFSSGEPLRWVGNTFHWPFNGNITSSDDLWINIESWPMHAAVSGSVVFSTDGNSWFSETLHKATPVGSNDHWYSNIGSFPSGTEVQYAVMLRDLAGDDWWDSNDGSDFHAEVE